MRILRQVRNQTDSSRGNKYLLPLTIRTCRLRSLNYIVRAHTHALTRAVKRRMGFTVGTWPSYVRVRNRAVSLDQVALSMRNDNHNLTFGNSTPRARGGQGCSPPRAPPSKPHFRAEHGGKVGHVLAWGSCVRTGHVVGTQRSWINTLVSLPNAKLRPHRLLTVNPSLESYALGRVEPAYFTRHPYSKGQISRD